VSTSGWRRLDFLISRRKFLREHSLEFPDLFWLSWAAIAGVVLSEMALLVELVLPSANNPSFLRLLFLWPIWSAITLSDVLFAADLFHGTGLEIAPITGIIGAIIFAGTAALLDIVPSARDRLRLTIVVVWIAGIVFTAAGWSLVRSAEPFTSGSRAEIVSKSINNDDPSADWHRAIRRVAVHGYTVEIETLLHPGDTKAARPICVAAANAKTSGELHLATAWVRTVDGEVLCGGSA
jgi:hypothetical protein